MLALYLKAIHVGAAILFLGTGLGSAFYKLRADRSGSVAVAAWAQRNVVLADWLFTVPSGLVLPLSGLWLVHLYGLPLSTSWVLFGLVGFAIAGLTWLPAAWIQLRMRRLADDALADGHALPPEFFRLHRLWLALGVPSFLAAIATIWVMVGKHAAWP